MSVRPYENGKPLPRGSMGHKKQAPTAGSKTQKRKAGKAAHMRTTAAQRGKKG
jgi:hypothetical protein